MKVKTYYNLTQCHGPKMVYFRSTDVEQMNYHRLLWSVPDEWFYWMHKGYGIHVIDKSSNGRGKIERIFIPVLNDILILYLLDYGLKNLCLIEHIDSAHCAMMEDRQLHRKYKFWHGKIDKIQITAKTIHVDKEENPI